MEEKVVRETISITQHNVTDEDKALAAEFNKTAWQALAQANRYLIHGPESARLNITKSFIGVLSRLSAVDTESALEAHRTTFLRELAEMRSINATSTETIPELSYDQD